MSRRDPFGLVDRPHKVRTQSHVRHGSKSMRGWGKMRFRTFYGTKFNPFRSGWKGGSRT